MSQYEEDYYRAMYFRETPIPPEPIELDIPELPPSMNDIVGQGSRWRYTKSKKHWGELLADLLPRIDRVESIYATGQLTFGRRGNRDQGNYRFMLEKALGDALQEVGILEDDQWNRYQFGDLTYAYEKDVQRTRLMLLPNAILPG